MTKKMFNFAYITFVNNCPQYIDLMKSTIDSVIIFSKYPLIVYCIDFDGTAVFVKHDRIIINNIANQNLNSIYYYKPYIIIDAIKNGLCAGYYIESDDVLTPFCDNVKEIAESLREIPISPIHPNDVQPPPQDMKMLGITKKTQHYIHGHVVFNSRNLQFLTEWFNGCNSTMHQFINADETVLNLMYWKYNCQNHYIGNKVITCDPYYLEFEADPVIRDIEHIYTFHGCKNPHEQRELLNKMIKYYMQCK